MKRMRKELREAISTFAKAVRQIEDLYDLPEPDSRTDYHAAEYSKVMAGLLIDQLITASDNPSERDELLERNGLEHLIEDMHIRARELEME